MKRAARSAAAGMTVLAGLLALSAPPAKAGPAGGAPMIEQEFAAAIRKVVPATVVCAAKGAPPGPSGSSGVLISKDGYVLSDSASNVILETPKSPRRTVSDVEVRVPDPVSAGKAASSHVYAAKVIRVLAGPVDSSLLKITSPPPGGFPFVTLSTSNDLHVGAFTFAVGNSFGASEEGTPTLTAGIVASLVRAPDGDPVGRNLEIYTSAAVNPGVNGGPLVDVEGALVGVISTYVVPAQEPQCPYQFLGRAIPIDRVRAAYKDLPQAAAIFPDAKTLPAKSKQADLLERAVEAASRRAYGSVVSLDVKRSHPLEMKARDDHGRVITLPRYTGPVSGVVVSGDGFVVTALYNLANTLGLSDRRVPNEIEKELKDILEVHVDFPNGVSAAARLVAHDQRLGIACFKADIQDYGTKGPEGAPPESFDVGRTVLCVANPFGGVRCVDPFVTMGILSRMHPADSFEAWRGDFQSDAGMTDGNAGGALVDLRGRILGIAMPWQPSAHGRNSGIGFGVPWDRIVAALPALEAGTSFRFGNGFLGVGWTLEAGRVRINALEPGAAAEKAGIKVDDWIVAVDGKPVKGMLEAQDAIRSHDVGDKLKVTVERGGKPIDFDVVLGARPAPTGP